MTVTRKWNLCSRFRLDPGPETRVTPAVQLWNCMLIWNETHLLMQKTPSLFSSKQSQRKLTFQAFLHQAFSHLFSVRNSSSCMSQCCFCVSDHLVTKRSLSLRSTLRQCHRLVWPSWLRCPRVSPTKELAWTLPVATSAPQRCCHSAGLIPFPRNYWATWRKEEVQTLSAPSCSSSQGQVLLTTLPGRRPRYDPEHGRFG